MQKMHLVSSCLSSMTLQYRFQLFTSITQLVTQQGLWLKTQGRAKSPASTMLDVVTDYLVRVGAFPILRLLVYCKGEQENKRGRG